jgi:hypothetical protein
MVGEVAALRCSSVVTELWIGWLGALACCNSLVVEMTV